MDAHPLRFRFLLAWILAGLAGVFVLDWLTPLGFAVWLLYFLPLSASYWLPGRTSAYALAACCTVLVVAGFFLSPPGMRHYSRF